MVAVRKRGKATEVTPEVELRRKELAQKLGRIFLDPQAGLTEKQKTALRLRGLEGLTWSEAAAEITRIEKREKPITTTGVQIRFDRAVNNLLVNGVITSRDLKEAKEIYGKK